MLKNVVIATHFFTYGPSQAARDYFVRKRISCNYIEHDLFGNVLKWSIQMLDTFWKVLKTGTTYDLYIGCNNLNTFVGLVLKKLHLVKKVIFYSQEYSPDRFSNKLMNAVYHWLDFFCLKHSDLIWNSSVIMQIDPMMHEREKRGIPKKYREKQIQVPDGTDLKKIPAVDKINRNLIGFVGHLREGLGLNLLFDAFEEICDQFPLAELLVIGSGPLEMELRKRAQRNKQIIMTGYMGDINKVYSHLAKCAFAVAPYEDNPFTPYTDPGKVKLYLSIGLPMIITKVPLIAYEIEKEKCGIAIDPETDALAQSMAELLKNDNALLEYRANVLNMRKKYSWDVNFDRGLDYLDKTSFSKQD